MMTDKQIRALIRELDGKGREWDTWPEHSDYSAGRALSYHMAAAMVKAYLTEE